MPTEVADFRDPAVQNDALAAPISGLVYGSPATLLKINLAGGERVPTLWIKSGHKPGARNLCRIQKPLVSGAGLLAEF
jgi:hypothetical protein